MELSPLGVYKQAVSAVPSLKYALGVAGAIAGAMIAYNLANEDPKKAILAFVFVLAGMYLLLIFASAGRIGDIVRGPVIAIVWALTILFIACLAMTLSAFAIGEPSGWAKFVGAVPADMRGASVEKTEPSVTSPEPSVESPPQAQAPVAAVETPAPIPVKKTFDIKDSSDDCGINRSRTLEYCLADGAWVTDWAGPQIYSANCGSNISNIRLVDSKPNCIAVDILLRGCGYDNILGIQNCRGRGWVGGTIVLNGERSSM
jgi:hypothetical protein